MEMNMTPWHARDRRYRLRIRFDAAGCDRWDHIMEAEIDFHDKLRSCGFPEAFNANSLYVVEVDRSGQLVDGETAFQWEPAAERGFRRNAAGKLLLMARGFTAGDSGRIFEVYFDLPGSRFAPARVSPLVALTDPVIDEDQSCFRIETSSCVYYYQKQGAGFSSMLDRNGNDWLGYRPGRGPAGEFRGIPNSGVFHPGYTLSTSRVTANGPLRTTIRSETLDEENVCQWEIYPTHATFTMLKSAEPFWFLYEGTPGGKFDQDRDFVIRSSGARTTAAESWSEVLDGLKWVCFGDAASRRVLYAVHHEPDECMISYWAMQREMTVLGFGRSPQGAPLQKYLVKVPNRFSIGFHDSDDVESISRAVRSVVRASCAVASDIECVKAD